MYKLQAKPHFKLASVHAPVAPKTNDSDVTSPLDEFRVGRDRPGIKDGEEHVELGICSVIEL
ncbi:MAG: hypothetical protein AAF437_11425 [Pseudomonadota bacterium]